MTDVSSFFKSLSDETRLRCLNLLIRHGELCVCELHQAIDISQPKMSRHLAFLKKNGLVQYRKEGTWALYRIHDNLECWMRDILQKTAVGLEKTEPFITDENRFNPIRENLSSTCCALCNNT